MKNSGAAKRQWRACRPDLNLNQVAWGMVAEQKTLKPDLVPYSRRGLDKKPNRIPVSHQAGSRWGRRYPAVSRSNLVRPGSFLGNSKSQTTMAQEKSCGQQPLDESIY